MLFMYYPFRSENDLKSGNPPTYANKLRESSVTELVNQNHLKVEIFENIVNDAFERLSLVLKTNMDPLGQQENDETYQQSQQLEESDTDNCDSDFSEIENQARYADATSKQIIPLFSDDMINENIRSLNEEQRKSFDV